MEKFSFEQLFSGGVISAVVGLLTWWTTSRTSQRQHRADALARASEMYRDMSTSDRARMEYLMTRLDAQEAKLNTLDERNAELMEENRRFKSVVGDVLRWVTELAAWEAAGAKPPPPYTAAQLLSRLKNLMSGLDL